jgi:undecaprenyl-diphosphatase
MNRRDRLRAIRATSVVYIRRRSDLVAVGAGAVVVAGCARIVADGTVGSVEESVFHAINGLPDWLQGPMWVFQFIGLLLIPLVIAAGAWAFSRRRLAIMLVLAVPAKLVFERLVVKQVVERERPGTTVVDAVLRDASASGLSFPSGHAVIAFAIAGLLAPYLSRRWTVAVYTLAALNAFARIYLGAHNPLDVIAGAALGIAIAGAFNFAAGVPGWGRQ